MESINTAAQQLITSRGIAASKGIRISETENFCLLNPESWKFLLVEFRQNPGLWNPEYSCRNPESHKQLEFAIQIQLKKNWNPVIEIRNPWRGIQNPRLSWIP